MFVMDFDTLHSESLLKVSRKVFFNLKGYLRIAKKVKKEKIGKENGTFLIDGAYICLCKIIKCPTNTNDVIHSLQWIIGGVDEENPPLYIFWESSVLETIPKICTSLHVFLIFISNFSI